MCILLRGMGHFGSLRGHHSLQTASEVKSDLRFEISDPKYLLIHVHIATIAFKHPLEVKYNLRFEIRDPNYIS